MFSFKSFIVSSLIFRSLIHFEFVYVCGVRECSNFILLHVAVQFSQHHLLKRLSSPLYILVSFIKDKVTICAWVYLWAFYPVPLIYISVKGLFNYPGNQEVSQLSLQASQGNLLELYGRPISFTASLPRNNSMDKLQGLGAEF